MEHSSQAKKGPNESPAVRDHSSNWIFGKASDPTLIIVVPLFVFSIIALGWQTSLTGLLAVATVLLFAHQLPSIFIGGYVLAKRKANSGFVLACLFFAAFVVWVQSSVSIPGIALLLWFWAMFHSASQVRRVAELFGSGQLQNNTSPSYLLGLFSIASLLAVSALFSPDQWFQILKPLYLADLLYLTSEQIDFARRSLIVSAVLLNLLFLVRLFAKSKHGKGAPFRIILVVATSVMTWWLSVSTFLPLEVGAASWMAFHALQSVVLVKHYTASQRSPGSSKNDSHFWLLVALSLIGGLFYLLGQDYASPTVIPVITNIALGTTVLHYLLEPVVFGRNALRETNFSTVSQETPTTAHFAQWSNMTVFGILVGLIWIVSPQVNLETQTRTGRKKLEAYQTLVTTLPESGFAHFELGKFALASRRYEQAVVNLRKSVQLNKQNAQAWIDLATALQLSASSDSDYGQAIEAFEKGLALMPSSAVANANLGLIYLRKNEFGKAVLLLEEAARVSSSNSSILGNLADAYFSLGRYEQAASVYEQATKLEKSPEYSNFYRSQAKQSREALRKNAGPPPVRALKSLSEELPKSYEGYSNISKEDYVGPEACGECHTEQYEQWQKHPHRTMNAVVTDSGVVGDFGDVEIRYGDGKARFHKKNQKYLMSLYQDEVLVRQYEITHTVGSTEIQMYIGRLVMGSRSPGNRRVGKEGKLPFSYSIKRKAWYPETYDDPWHQPEFDDENRLTKAYRFYDERAGHWGTNCAWCHNTYAYEERLKLPAKVTGLQDYWYGFDSKDVTYSKTKVPKGLTADEVALDESKFVTVGISCESCHFGGRLHANEGWPIQFVPSGSGLEFTGGNYKKVADARKDPYVINSICGQCHASRNPAYPNGAGTWNSRAARDLNLGACADQIKCTDCHDPHVSERGLADSEKVRRAETACLKCHGEFSTRSAQIKHSGHGETADLSCTDCHMPRIVHGLSDMVRSHTISSPTDERMFAKNAPNACNICHLDKSVNWTIDNLQKLWGVKVSLEDSWLPAYGGSFDYPVGALWLNHSAPMMRQVALDAYSRTSSIGDALRKELIKTLNDSVPANRLMGMPAVERILGRKIPFSEYSPYEKPKEREDKIEKLLRSP
ncbi:MAG: tetratricopeptide repeat protein [Myxococcota bacterium]|nr:tetratricopeptide repeat protein [Myxococcota bacterium]